jgi:hypothetical protein
MSCFIVVVHELVNYFEFNIIPSYLLQLHSTITNVFNNVINFSNNIKETINSGNKKYIHFLCNNQGSILYIDSLLNKSNILIENKGKVVFIDELIY